MLALGCCFKIQRRQGRPVFQMGEMGAFQCSFTDTKQVKSRFFSRNHRHEAQETGDFPHLRLHVGGAAEAGLALRAPMRPNPVVESVQSKLQLLLPLQRGPRVPSHTCQAWAPSARSHHVGHLLSVFEGGTRQCPTTTIQPKPLKLSWIKLQS